MFEIKIWTIPLKVLSRLSSSRPARRNGEYVAASSLTNDGEPVESDDSQLSSADELEVSKMSLPPRYRFRDLLLGDFAFRDDGERWVTLHRLSCHLFTFTWNFVVFSCGSDVFHLGNSPRYVIVRIWYLMSLPSVELLFVSTTSVNKYKANKSLFCFPPFSPLLFSNQLNTQYRFFRQLVESELLNFYSHLRLIEENR